ncbi:metal-dependent hydrolase [Salarchaeum japonicum]|uniref:Metal-dependent hydrolase n=1 Tax=Salarchaeum japonicum TaxID=555573 RepID=A0AAV3SY69_9EURY|nr:metal-dependent hydrolase [Salarchaeum japonicum]
MPSTLVHVAIGGIVAVALLGAAFDRRSVLVVLAAAALPDFDTFLGFWIAGGHRAVLHNLVLPAVALGALAVDTRRPISRLRRRYGDRGVRVAFVALAAFVFGGVLPDLVVNGVNAFYPVHDRFYTVNGELLLSNQRGLVQTFVDLSPAGDTVGGTTANTHYYTGVDPSAGAESADVERVFPVVTSGFRLLVVVLSGFLLAARFRERQR